MKFTRTMFKQLVLIELEINEDERGFFARAWCKDELEAFGIRSAVMQSSIARSRLSGTLRGLHYQEAPFAGDKIVTCLHGSVYDVVVDLRDQSETYLEWASFELSASNHRMLFIPAGFAHGYQTLADDSLVLYYSAEVYNPAAELGIRHDDPFFQIKWPLPVRSITEKDRTLANFDAEKAPRGFTA